MMSQPDTYLDLLPMAHRLVGAAAAARLCLACLTVPLCLALFASRGQSQPPGPEQWEPIAELTGQQGD